MRSVLCPLFVLLAVLTSCARIPLISPPDPLYRGLTESFADFDASVLVGRTIVVDPGHGGRFDGAVGRKNTREADVNLGVALELARMLDNCGADVILTRSGDSDLLPEDQEPVVREDLSERVRISNEIDADLFISIHHNSTASGRRDYNAVETYYRMEDDGPSLDAARYVHRHMVKNLGIPEYELVPGNYYVLRNNENPSLLGEASYISNPDVEKKIRKKEKQLLEARAYLLGILDYFSRGVPTVDIIEPSASDTIHGVLPMFYALLNPGEGGGGVDVSTITADLDGRKPEWTFDENRSRLTVIPTEPIAPGRHSLRIAFRNRMGNSSRSTVYEFLTITNPSVILTRSSPERIPAGSKTPFLLEATVLDGYGNTVADGTPVSIILPGSIEGNTEARTYGGTALFYLTAKKEGLHRCTVKASGASQPVKIRAYRDALLPLVVRLMDAEMGIPLPKVKVDIDGDLILISNRDGYVFSGGLPRGEHRVMASRPGYKPYRGIINTDERGSDSGLRVLMLEPVHGGVLLGKTIVIDPEGGGKDAGPTGPSGTRSIDLNLRVARYLSDYLTRAGARVYLTRSSDESVPADRRVALANRVGAEYFISIRHTASTRDEAAPYIAYYGTSESGKAIASSITAEWQAVMEERAWIREEYSYVLQQTPCPAVSVMCHDIGTPAREEETYLPGYGLREAYSIYSGLISHLLGPGGDSVRILNGMVQFNRPIEAMAVLEIDDWLVIGCDERSHFKVRNISPGEHRIELIEPSRSQHFWWIDTEETGDSPVILAPD